MPTTRKKVIKTVYEDENDSEKDAGAGDFSASESDAQISEHSSSDEEIEAAASSEDEFKSKSKKKAKGPIRRKRKFAKEFLSKLSKQPSLDNEEEDVTPTLITVKDLTEQDKLLPSILNLSESDSSDDEPSTNSTKEPVASTSRKIYTTNPDSDNEGPLEYKDVWSQNVQENSEEIAKKAFMELQKHKTVVDETKTTLQNYVPKERKVSEKECAVNVKDLLALGEEVTPQKSPSKQKTRTKRLHDDSDSEVEDWEEVKESKSIPKQGLQLFVELPDSVSRKTKKVDVEMMMKRKINRVKKEHQVYMHKVHVLCWLGHGNYVSRILNDQEVLAAALAMVPKGCYPEERLTTKYVEDITKWYKDKITIKQDKNENKFRPKAPPLKSILLDQIKTRKISSKKYAVFVFVAMLRALGLQCRVMFNFVTLPIRPPSSELCSLSTKPKEEKNKTTEKSEKTPTKPALSKTKVESKPKSTHKIPQVDGIYDQFSSDSEFENIMQIDGNNDALTVKTRSTRSRKATTNDASSSSIKENEEVSPAKKIKKDVSPSKESVNKIAQKTSKTAKTKQKDNTNENKKTESLLLAQNNTNDKGTSAVSPRKTKGDNEKGNELSKSKSPKVLSLKKASIESKNSKDSQNLTETIVSPRKTRSGKSATSSIATKQDIKKRNTPKILVTNVSNDTKEAIESKYFPPPKEEEFKTVSTRKRSHTANPNDGPKKETTVKVTKAKTRTKSEPSKEVESKYFDTSKTEMKKPRLSRRKVKEEDKQRVSHRDLGNQAPKPSVKAKNDITGDLVHLVKKRIKEAKQEAKSKLVKGKVRDDSDEDSDYLSEEEPKRRKSESDDDFKPTKISPRPLNKVVKQSSCKKIDRRVLSTTDEELEKKNRVDVWCELYVEELEQWISVDVIHGKIHCPNEIYGHCTHPVCYIVGWDNNNYLKDVTRRYVPHWNTVTRKQRAEPEWWRVAIQPWLGPKTPRDKEEDEQLDNMQLEAPLPKSIAEYKNHPLYALKRHLLKFEAIYPPDAATLGFVRGEPVYARECVYVCRSRDIWLKEAKVVRLGEQPYKIVTARPKWDKLSNRMIKDKLLELFGPWQVDDYEPPVAENGIVPRNAYGNVELFKECMLPKGTVVLKLPGLNKVAKKLNIDCAPAMTGFDFHGGWSHPVYDGFVVCKEFEEVLTEAWIKDQEDQERREREKIESRVYGNWKRLIKGLLIKERLKLKYGFEEPTSEPKKDTKGPRLVVKKK